LQLSVSQTRGEKQIIEMKNGKKLILRTKKARGILEKKVRWEKAWMVHS